MSTIKSSTNAMTKNLLATLLVVASLSQSAVAQYNNNNCYIDAYGRTRCRRRGLFGGSLAGAIVGAIAGGVLLILVLAMCLIRKRRAKKANEAYMTHAQQQQPQMVATTATTQQTGYGYGVPTGGAYYNNTDSNANNISSGATMYPQQGGNEYSQYSQQQYAPPTSAPPQAPVPSYNGNSYAPPSGAPPTGGDAAAYYGNQRGPGAV